MPIIKGDFILKITNFFRIINTKNPKRMSGMFFDFKRCGNLVP